MRMLRNVVVLAVVAGLSVGALSAAEKEKKKAKKGGDPVAAKSDGMFKTPQGIDLNEEQKKKFDEIKSSLKPKVEELVKKDSEALTPEQRKARAEASKAAKNEGKKGKELKAAVDAAVQLSPETQAKLAEVTKLQAELQKEFNEKLKEILTDEQKAKLPTPKKGKKAA